VSKPYAGGCACGVIRYETTHEPVFQNHCQCRQCQYRSGTGHASYLTFPGRADMTITGKPTEWRVAADNGNEKDHAFCPTCGTPVYLTFVATPEMIAVHAASLDEPQRFDPTVVTYGARALAWDTINPALTTLEKMPPG
jgi:hypothetical protein